MASFDSHLTQVKSNLKFLENLCISFKYEYWDWKVTSCYYVAVHIINAHIANKTNLHYQTHGQVNSVINYVNTMSVCRLEKDIYLAYDKLNILSRRSRYLVNLESTDNDNELAYMTYDKHFKRAVKLLDKILIFFSAEYSIELDTTKIHCLELKGEKLDYFLVQMA